METDKFNRQILAKQLGMPRFFGVQEFTYRALGVNITSLEFHYHTIWIAAGSGLLTIFLIIIMGHFAFTHLQDVTLTAETLSPFLQFILISWKVIIMLFNRTKLVKLIRRIEKMCLNVNADERKILLDENLKDKRLSTVYYFSVMITGLTSMLSPLVKLIAIYFTTGEIYYSPIFNGTFPFDINIFGYFFLSYVWCSICVYFALFGTVSVDSLYSWYVHNMAAQFRILQCKLDNLSECPSEKDLGDWLHAHEERIEVTEELNTVYAPLMFTQFTLNSAQICFIAFQINGGVNLADLPFHSAFLIAVLVQPLIYCYGGEHVENETGNVAFAVYGSCNWLTWSVRKLKMMQLVIMRAQKTCKLTGIFFEVNFALYLWVMRTAASYITILYSFKN